MARLFCIPASILLFAAFILNVIVTVSLPYLPALDIVRAHFPNGAVEDGRSLTEIRVSNFFSLSDVVHKPLSCSLVFGMSSIREDVCLSFRPECAGRSVPMTIKEIIHVLLSVRSLFFLLIAFCSTT